MPTICVASLNPVKLRASLSAFQRIFPERQFCVRGVDAPSGVRDQPMSHVETMQGAANRVDYVRAAMPDADYWVGIEGGIEDTDRGMRCFAWARILDREGREGRGQTAVFYLPREVAESVRAGLELGHAVDAVFGLDNSKQAGGAIGVLTDDVIDREAYYVHALTMALLPFKNPRLSW